MDWSGIPQHRRRAINEELRNALVPLVISSRSTLEFLRMFCQRFDINETGGSFEAGGRESTARAAYALIPKPLVPAGLVEIEHPEATEAVAALGWAAICKAIDFEALRIAMSESPAFFATFATAPPVEGEEALFSPTTDTGTERSWAAQLPNQLITPRAYSTVWTLTAPLAHGHDEKHGNVMMFRRQRTVSPITGELSLVPFVSGNAVRGCWRDLIFGRLLQLVGLKSHDLPPQRAHALLSGGTIEKGSDNDAVDVTTRRRARDMSPAWDLFAGVIDAQIMRGLLRVHDGILLCRENAWLLHSFLKPKVDGRALRLEEFEATLKPADALTQLRLLTRHAHRDIEGSDGAQMLVNTEVLLPGSQIMHRFQIMGLDGVSSLALSCMADLLHEFEESAFIGAGNARGHGAIAFDPYRPADPEVALPSPDEYRAWVAAHTAEIREWLLEGKRATSFDGATSRGRARGKGRPQATAPEETP